MYCPISSVSNLLLRKITCRSCKLINPAVNVERNYFISLLLNEDWQVQKMDGWVDVTRWGVKGKDQNLLLSICKSYLKW